MRLWSRLVLLTSLCACAAAPDRRFEVCEALLPAFLAEGEHAEILDRRPAPEDPGRVIIAFMRETPAPDGRGILACTFADDGRGGRLALIAVEESATGPLSAVKLQLLRRELGHELGLDLSRPPAFDMPPRVGAPGGPRALPYLVQQLINTLILGAIYGLTAVGYTLVYGVIGVINFAYGEIYMLGAFAALSLFAVVGAVGGSWLPAALLAALGTAVLVSAGHAWVAERLVFRPLAHQPSRALIAAIALSISLQEYMRLAQGSRSHWLSAMSFGSMKLMERDGFAVHVTGLQTTIVALAFVISLGLALLLSRSRFGRELRAVAQDSRMSAMLGVDVNRTVATTFALGGALAGVAGLIDAVYYGGVGFFMGYIVGFKALTAALLGGIGSVGGALLGGLLIGAIETFWAAYLDSSYRDVAVFGVLVLVLTFRPSGLLGVEEKPIERAPAGR
ncbi:MAG TPA: branched-chain amino acid ABC transporter permease [Alphaproteobacteria bacterium]|nr:branched-chain amino acid ABC transporter permease [Alphaproteobacteria bacterium]